MIINISGSNCLKSFFYIQQKINENNNNCELIRCR